MCLFHLSRRVYCWETVFGNPLMPISQIGFSSGNSPSSELPNILTNTNLAVEHLREFYLLSNQLVKLWASLPNDLLWSQNYFFFKWCDVLPALCLHDIGYRPARGHSAFGDIIGISESKIAFFHYFSTVGTEEKESWCFGSTQQALRGQAQFQAPQGERAPEFPLGQDKIAYCRVSWAMAFVWLTLRSLSGPTSNKPIVRCWGHRKNLCPNVYSPVDRRHNSTNNDSVSGHLLNISTLRFFSQSEFYSSFQTPSGVEAHPC